MTRHLVSRVIKKKQRRREAAERRATDFNTRMYEQIFGSDTGEWSNGSLRRRQVEPILASELVETIRVSLEAHSRSSNRTMIEPILRLIEKALEAEEYEE